MKRNVAYVVAGFVAGAILTGSTAMAAVTSYVQAQKNSAYVTVDGQHRSDGNSLIYSGTTYAQLYSIQQSLKDAGFGVTWDGRHFDIQTPKFPTPSGDSVNISTLQPSAINNKTWISDQEVQVVRNFTDGFNQQQGGGFLLATHGFTSSGTPEDISDMTYDINSQYTTLSGVIDIDESLATDSTVYSDVASLKIIGDGKTLFQSGAISTGMQAPLPVNVNVKGISKLEIVFSTGHDTVFAHDKIASYCQVGFVNVNLSK